MTPKRRILTAVGWRAVGVPSKRRCCGCWGEAAPDVGAERLKQLKMNHCDLSLPVTFNDRHVAHHLPLMPRAVIHRRIVAQVFCEKISMRSLQADLAIGDHLLAWGDPALGIDLLQLLW